MGHSVRYNFKFCAFLLESIWSILILEHGLTFPSRVPKTIFIPIKIMSVINKQINKRLSGDACSQFIQSVSPVEANIFSPILRLVDIVNFMSYPI